jgi:hypothetical protein
MEYADRFIRQQADQAIGRDVTRALVELITNCNDRYTILEGRGEKPDGIIVIEIQRRDKGSIIKVRDFATGMSSNDMDKKVGVYADATSGFKEGELVRGLWGRGLKDSVFGLGHGAIQSIHDDSFNSCSLLIRSGKAMYEREPSRAASRAIRKQLGINSGNGTIVEIIVSRDDVRTPLFDKLRRSLEHHFEIRSILGNPNRQVILKHIAASGAVKQELRLSYTQPVGSLILEESFQVPGTAADATLTLFRSDEELSTPGEEHEYADGGILIMSDGVVLDLTLLKFENNEFATRIFGRLDCKRLRELLKQDEPVLTATRDGINWKHSFTKSLKDIVEEKLEPFIEEERRQAMSERRSGTNKRLREKLESALRELNDIANLELGDSGIGTGGGDGHGEKAPFVPPGGFGFVPEFAYVQTGKPAGLTLRAHIPLVAENGALVMIECDSPEIVVLTPQVVIEAKEEFPHVGQARVEIEGRQVGAEAVIVATLEGANETIRAEAFVRVTSVKVRKPIEPNKKKGGLFNECLFDPTAEPRQRVRFDRASSNIVIATKAPSVAVYLGEDGEGIENSTAQVLLAELITEALCREIARQGVENGKYLAPYGGESDAIQRKYVELQNLYAHRIHSCVVDSRFQRTQETGPRKRRPTKDEMLSNAITAAG